MAEEHTTAAIAEGPYQPLPGLGVWQADRASQPFPLGRIRTGQP
jgi:hypothetical protein